MAAAVYRHNRITRLTHWLNALALAILFMSGLQIFNAHPNLYWGSKSEPQEAFFSIYATDESGEVRGYTRLLGWQAETTGVLGIQNTDMGPFPRAFPSWLTIPGYFWLAGGRRWHFFFAWVFVINGLLYLVFNLAKRHFGKFFPRPRDLAKVPAMVWYYLRLRRESPQEEEYNPLQKLAYSGVVWVLVPVVILSGLAMSPQLDAGFHWLPALFGGRQSARTFHFLCAFVFVLFTFGHVFMVITTGVINNMRSMVTGWYVEKITPATEPAQFEAPVEELASPTEPVIGAPPPTPAEAEAGSEPLRQEEPEVTKEEGKNGAE
jgi:Ni/Fe-hydrogenase b-type cytochrome subunit